MNSVQTQNINELSKKLLERLKKLNFNLSCAESCTGGLLSSFLTNIPGSSSQFFGGCIAYDNSIKHSILDISWNLLETHGAVSQETAEAMAKGGKQKFKTDICLSTTGIAGPSGGSEQKPVGTVWIGFAGPHHTKAKLLNLQGNRESIRLQSVEQAILFALENLK